MLSNSIRICRTKMQICKVVSVYASMKVCKCVSMSVCISYVNDVALRNVNVCFYNILYNLMVNFIYCKFTCQFQRNVMWAYTCVYPHMHTRKPSTSMFFRFHDTLANILPRSSQHHLTTIVIHFYLILLRSSYHVFLGGFSYSFASSPQRSTFATALIYLDLKQKPTINTKQQKWWMF
jgi:hypothetical protein